MIDTRNRYMGRASEINPLKAELNPICHLLALLGAHHIFHVSRMRVNSTFYSGAEEIFLTL